MTDPTEPARRSRFVLDQRGGNLAIDLAVLNNHVSALLDAAFTGSGVTPAQYTVYGQLGLGAATPRQLALTLGIHPATLTGYLSAIERRGHLRRERNEQDGRSHVLTLTEAGEAHRVACRDRLRSALRVLTKELGGSDRVTLVRTVLGELDEAVVSATETVVARAAD